MVARFAKAVSLLTILHAGLALCKHGQTSSALESQACLRGFYQGVVRNPSVLPKHEDLYSLTTRIGGAMSANEIEQGLPSVLSALAHPSAQVKFVACAALFAIAGRPDGARLLKGHIEAIGHDLLTVEDKHVQSSEGMVLTRIRPTPPEVVRLLLQFLKQTDRDDGAKAGAVFALVQIAPDNPEVATETLEFLSRRLDNDTRIAVLNALGNPRITDPRLISTVISGMSSPDQGVRSTAVQSATRIGKRAVQQAEPVLRRLTADPNQPVEITRQAKQALELIGN